MLPSTVHSIDFSQATAPQRNPLNLIGAPQREYILQKLELARQSAQITSVLLTGGDDTDHFSAGGDLTEFTDPPPAPKATTTITLRDVVSAIESFPKPVIAVVHGKVLGGAMEVAMSCHYRIATSDSTWALPEVQNGMIPGSGGTQRLPRLVGMAKAIDMILTGRSISGQEAFTIGLVDFVVNKDENLLQSALKFPVEGRIHFTPLDHRRVGQRKLQESPAQVKALCQAAAKKLPSIEMGGEAVHCALKALQAAGNNPAEGSRVEDEMAKTILASPQGKARRHVFFAIRQAQKPLVVGTPPALITDHRLLTCVQECDVAVIGAGTMGVGIAMVLLQTGYRSVYLMDIYPQALEKGVAFLKRTIQSFVKKKKVTFAQAKRFQSALRTTTKLEDLSGCQLVVEAAVERLQIKQAIFQKLDEITPKNCILLSNTSTLDIDKMAKVLSPERRTSFAGWHFFSPAHMMQLVEIVVGRDTTSDNVALLQALTKKIGKIGVVVGNCDGFCGNRMALPYAQESVLLLQEGAAATVERVDSALRQFGMALGPLSMSDLAGNDVGYNVRRERGWVRDPKTCQVGPNRPARYSELADDLVVKLGRTGQKAGKGWFDYDPHVGRGYKPIPSKEVSKVVQTHVQKKTSANQLSQTEIVERVLFALVNEGFKCLEDNIARCPSDIDAVYVLGYGWPKWRGGPMYWADHEVGLGNLLVGLTELSRQFPQTEYYVPSKLLQKCVSLGIMVEEFYQNGIHNRRSKL